MKLLLLLPAVLLLACNRSKETDDWVWHAPDSAHVERKRVDDSIQMAQEKDQPPPAPVSAWSYDESQEQMGRGTIKRAWVRSSNEIEFGSPYEGEQRATLTVRQHPKFGKDVILSIERGQFLCGYEDCKVAVRFDDGKAQNYSASEPADHSTTTLFLSGFNRFLASARKAKKMQIEALFFQEGSRVFEFDVSGLTW